MMKLKTLTMLRRRGAEINRKARRNVGSRQFGAVQKSNAAAHRFYHLNCDGYDGFDRFESRLHGVAQ